VFAKTATINRALAWSDILLGLEVVEVRAVPIEPGTSSVGGPTALKTGDDLLNGAMRYEVVLRRAGAEGPSLVVPCTVVVDARGIGVGTLPRIPIEGGNLQDTRARAFYAAPSPETFPRLTTSQEFYSMTSALRDPFAPFAGKSVALVGAGDSSKTIWEFLLRCNAGGASTSVISGGNLQRAVWVGQKLRTRNEYREQTRGR
jgi:hypothetical protein